MLFQEAFLFTHRLIGAAPAYTTVVRGNGPGVGLRRLWEPLGSGLLLAARLPREQVVDVWAEPFGVCEGRFRGLNDCWCRKGFLRARIRLNPWLEIDIYTLHLDAGGSSRDREARRRQLALLTARIREQSAARGLILAGDFNLNAHDPADRALLEAFVGGVGLTDAGVSPAPADWPEHLDYIFYRSGHEVAVELIHAAVDPVFAVNGRPLSDHPALGARFQLRGRDGCAS